MSKLIFTCAALLLLALPCAAQTPQPGEGADHEEKFLATYGIKQTLPTPVRLYPAMPEPGTKRIFRTRIPRDNVRRVRFKIMTAPAKATWYVRLYNGDKIIDDNLTGEKEVGEFWSSEIEANRPYVEVYCLEADCPLELEIDAVMVPTVQAKPQGQGGAKTNLIKFAGRGAPISEWGKSVARLRLVKNGKQIPCTGFLISRELLITNHHCIKSDAQRVSARADFDFDRNGARETNYEFKELVITDKPLDFTLLRLAVPLTDRQPFELVRVEPSNNEELIIIQHPLKELKQISMDEDCKVTNKDVTESDFGHKCDTFGGTSGSPIQNRVTGRLVGLHHFNYIPGVDNDLENRGVRINAIINFLVKNLNNKKPDVLKELNLQ